jgi:transcriptional regulator with XRE-family HTH domain
VAQKRARRLLRQWRKSHTPRVTQAECGSYIGKSGALIRMFETGRAELTYEDCIELSILTGIPLSSFLSRRKAGSILRAARMLQAPSRRA